MGIAADIVDILPALKDGRGFLRRPAGSLSLHEQALKLHAEAKTSEAMASIHGRGLRKRRDDKPALAHQIALMERALQLCIALDLPGLPDPDEATSPGVQPGVERSSRNGLFNRPA